jgi:two-component system, OmpR family, sensor histidine kinase BaeS
MRSIFSKTFLAMLLSSLSILIVMVLIMTMALRASILNWNQGKRQDLQELLIPIISKVHRLDGGLSEAHLEDALSPYMTDSLFVYVFDTDKKPIFILDRGEQLDVESHKDGVGLNPLLSSSSLMPVSDGEEIIAYLASDSVDFLSYKANREFIDTMKTIVMLGMVVSLLLSLVFSGWFSAGLSGQTALLVSGLEDLIRGRRTVEFPEIDTWELEQISRTAVELQSRLVKEAELRQQWMQDVSHDLRTPITAVMAQFEAMIDGALAFNLERMGGLLSEIRRIEVLVKNLQELSRYESPEMKVAPLAVGASVFIEELKERFTYLAEQKGIELKFKYDDLVLSIDQRLMQRCLSNIIQNAIQHTLPGGDVSVCLSRKENFVLIEIKNTGSLPLGEQDKIFDRLFRGSDSRARAGDGFGLGLSIAKAIVDLHHGNIWVENRGQKVVFSLLLPYSKKSLQMGPLA